MIPGPEPSGVRTARGDMNLLGDQFGAQQKNIDRMEKQTNKVNWL